MGSDGIDIIPATVNDAETLARIIRVAYAPMAKRFGITPENAPRHASNWTVEKVRSLFECRAAMFLLKVNGEPAGCAGYTAPENGVCEMIKLAVLPEFQRQGLGEKLVSLIIERTKELGVHRIEITLHGEFEELRNWYLRLGFTLDKIEPWQDWPFPVCFMHYAL